MFIAAVYVTDPDKVDGVERIGDPSRGSENRRHCRRPAPVETRSRGPHASRRQPPRSAADMPPSSTEKEVQEYMGQNTYIWQAGVTCGAQGGL